MMEFKLNSSSIREHQLPRWFKVRCASVIRLNQDATTESSKVRQENMEQSLEEGLEEASIIDV